LKDVEGPFGLKNSLLLYIGGLGGWVMFFCAGIEEFSATEGEGRKIEAGR
jgi:hypothetical protein